MARKRDYHAEYERRIAHAAERGITRQQARGHVEREHIQRAEREREELGGLSRYELARVEAFGVRLARHNRELDPQDIVDWAGRHGYHNFRNLERARQYLHREYRAPDRTRHAARTVEAAYQEAADYLDLDVDWDDLFDDLPDGYNYYSDA